MRTRLANRTLLIFSVSAIYYVRRALMKRTIRKATEGKTGLVVKLGRGGRRHCNDDSKDQSGKQFSTLGVRTGKDQLTGHAERQISSVSVLSP